MEKGHKSFEQATFHQIGKDEKRLVLQMYRGLLYPARLAFRFTGVAEYRKMEHSIWRSRSRQHKVSCSKDVIPGTCGDVGSKHSLIPFRVSDSSPKLLLLGLAPMILLPLPMDECFHSTTLPEGPSMNVMEGKECTCPTSKAPHYYSDCKKNITSLENTVGDLVCSVNQMMEIIQGMAIHLQQQDTELCALTDMVRQIQSTLNQKFAELHSELTPETKKNSKARNQSTTPTHIRQTIKRDVNVEKQEDKYTVIIDVSDEEDEKYRKKMKGLERPNDIKLNEVNPGVRHFAQTEREKVYGIKESNKFTVKPGYSEYRRTTLSKGSMHRSITGKKLSFTPKIENQLNVLATQSRMMMEKGHVLPENMESKFKVTPEMQLSIEEMYIAAYVFHPDADDAEDLFRMVDTIASVKDFESHCPPRVPSTLMVTLIAMKNTWLEAKNKTHDAWYLPPYFNNDVRVGSTLESMIDIYAKDWMPTYSTLKYIYVPIEEITGQWYLMVVSLNEKIIYHLDPYYEDQDIIRRRDNIRNLAEIISQMVQTEVFPPNFANTLQLGGWEISDAFAPSKGNGEHYSELISYSILWVMDWLYMRGAFQHNTLREMNTDILRMKIALDLLCGNHNEKWEIVQTKAKEFWVTTRYAARYNCVV
ncbi:Papain-like cysteine peptidase superfamily [Sesbania bispinosa]|nr:Papain-like cysteine peptidase superfamily [Sesbania bispinosa]